MLAERSLPGSLIVNQDGKRFANEAIDYMSFGQRVLELERAGNPVDSMWIVFDQKYRNSYVFAAEMFPRMAFRSVVRSRDRPRQMTSLNSPARSVSPKQGSCRP